MQAAGKDLSLSLSLFWQLLQLQLLFALNALACLRHSEIKRRSLRNVCTKCTATCRLVQWRCDKWRQEREGVGSLSGPDEPGASFTRIKRRQMLAIISFFVF